MRIYMEGLSLAERNILCSFISTKCSLSLKYFLLVTLNSCPLLFLLVIVLRQLKSLDFSSSVC